MTVEAADEVPDGAATTVEVAAVTVACAVMVDMTTEGETLAVTVTAGTLLVTVMVLKPLFALDAAGAADEGAGGGDEEDGCADDGGGAEEEGLGAGGGAVDDGPDAAAGSTMLPTGGCGPFETQACGGFVGFTRKAEEI